MIRSNLASVEHSSFGPRSNMRTAFKPSDVTPEFVRDLVALGIGGFSMDALEQMAKAAANGKSNGYGMDNLAPSITTASVAVPIQFLQNWLSGFVNVITAARKIDLLTGISTVGAWEDEEIVQGVMEQLGTSVPYTDLGNIPLSSWNVNWERRTVVRFEEGMGVGVLEEARASRIRVNSAEQKREAATLALEIQRNSVGFFGFNGGANRTYGFLNDPNLPAAIQFPAGASTSRDWSGKTFAEIQKDWRIAMTALRVNSQDTIDPGKTPITVALPTSEIDYLTVTTDQGVSVMAWIKDAYPNIRIESAPELINAVGGVSVFYAYAETVDDASTDDKRTWIQVVPAKFRLIGVEQKAKGYKEDYSNATAGVMLKRPFAVVRYLFG